MKMKLEELVSPEASPALGPYCHGRKYGDMIITSGQIPLTKDGEYVFEIKQATTLVLNNLLSIVEAGGGCRESIARVDVYEDETGRTSESGSITGIGAVLPWTQVWGHDHHIRTDSAYKGWRICI